MPSHKLLIMLEISALQNQYSWVQIPFGAPEILRHQIRVSHNSTSTARWDLRDRFRIRPQHTPGALRLCEQYDVMTGLSAERNRHRKLHGLLRFSL